MFYVLRVGAELDKRYLTYGGDFGNFLNARTFFSKEKAKAMANQITDLAVRVI